MTELPLITIGVSTYNRKDLLRLSLESLLAQTYPNCEIIVVDDGSSDDTETMVRKEFPSVTYIMQENAGDAAAKNHAARLAKGEYIVFNDSDDLFLPTAVTDLYEQIKDHPGACAYGSYITIDKDGNRMPTKSKVSTLPSGMITESLIRHVLVNSCGTLIPTALYRQLGGYDISLRHGHDWKLSLELSLIAPFYPAPSPVFLRRRHNSNVSAASYRGSANMLEVFEEFVAAHPGAYGKAINRRRADLHNKLAREAKKEKMSGAVIREHLRCAMRNDFSLKTFCRYLAALCK